MAGARSSLCNEGDGLVNCIRAVPFDIGTGFAKAAKRRAFAFLLNLELVPIAICGVSRVTPHNLNVRAKPIWKQLT
jgi:hypothetical protein